MSTAVIAILGVALVATALALIRVRNFFAAVALLSAYSGIIAVLFAVLGAADVAFTEAVVGAGVSTALLIAILRRADPGEAPRHSKARPYALLAALAVAGVLLYGVAALPPFGEAGAAGVSSAYVQGALTDSATPNVVTAILGDYRGFDTLIETTVVVTAAAGCVLVLGRRP